MPINIADTVGRLTNEETKALAVACMSELKGEDWFEVIVAALDEDQIAELVAHLTP